MGEEISCPKCKTTKYRDPSLKLMVNVCGHGLCENCVKLLFIKGSGNCPQCDLLLRKSDFRYQVFENSYVEKEVDIRRKILKDYNKKEEDFHTLKEYNDYLEMVETIIFNLANGVDVEATKRRIEVYKKENAEVIQKNRNKKSKDEELVEDLIEEEKEFDNYRRNHHSLLMEREQLAKVKKHQQEKLIDDLMISEGDAKEILDSHAELSKKRIQAVQERILKDEEEKRARLEQQISSIRTAPGGGSSLAGKFSTGITFSKSAPVQSFKTNESTEILDIYRIEEDDKSDLNGPKCPGWAELPKVGYLNHVVPSEEPDLAGGFIPSYPCLRALQEAFCELYFSPETHSLDS